MAHDMSFVQRPRIAHITNHGYAGVNVPYGGAPDTGGQNVYVNFIVEAMVELGYHVTVFTRGGFPFFESERRREGVEPYGEHARYVYVPGGGDEFVRKEDIALALDEEVDWLERFIDEEAEALRCRPWQVYELVDTHYWDAGVMGMLLTRRWRSRAGLEELGTIAGGVVSDKTLDEERLKGSHGSAGQSLSQVVGRLLLSETDPLSPIENRVVSALEAWCAGHSAAMSDEVLASVRQRMQADSSLTSPALASILAADVVGELVLELHDRADSEVVARLDDTERLVFTPHSLSVLKEENYRESPLDVRRNLKFCERRDHEASVCSASRAFAATSTEIAERLRSHHDVHTDRMFYFPAGVDRNLFRQYSETELSTTYRYLSEQTGLSEEELKRAQIVFETSRMDQTKRKDLLIDAFTTIAPQCPHAICIIGGGPKKGLFHELKSRIEPDSRVFLLGFIPDEVMYPLFSLADIFVTPSEMEGFGLSAAQAAAVGTSLVTSHLVPFALQYVPDDALIVRAGDVRGFADAILHLLTDHEDAEARGRRLSERTASLDWIEQTRSFLDHLRKSGLQVRKPTQ